LKTEGGEGGGAVHGRNTIPKPPYSLKTNLIRKRKAVRARKERVDQARKWESLVGGENASVSAGARVLRFLKRRRGKTKLRQARGRETRGRGEGRENNRRSPRKRGKSTHLDKEAVGRVPQNGWMGGTGYRQKKVRRIKQKMKEKERECFTRTFRAIREPREKNRILCISGDPANKCGGGGRKRNSKQKGGARLPKDSVPQKNC